MYSFLLHTGIITFIHFSCASGLLYKMWKLMQQWSHRVCHSCVHTCRWISKSQHPGSVLTYKSVSPSGTEYSQMIQKQHLFCHVGWYDKESSKIYSVCNVQVEIKIPPPEFNIKKLRLECAYFTHKIMFNMEHMFHLRKTHVHTLDAHTHLVQLVDSSVCDLNGYILVLYIKFLKS
jgi:hypothetical protein